MIEYIKNQGKERKIMPKNPGQKKKLLLIRQILHEQTDEDHGLSTEDIIKILDKSFGIFTERKSVKEDIDTLTELGDDICHYNDGPKKLYFVASRTFELAELKLLTDSVQSSRFITKKKSSELIKKLESLASVHQAKELGRQIYVAGKVKTMNESIYYTVDALHTAMSKNCAVSYKYFDYDENKNKVMRHNGRTYTASPWALICNEDNYYMRAFDHDEKILKNFRVDKMADVEILSSSREGRTVYESTDPEKYTQRTFSMYGDGEILVTIHFHRSLCGVMVDRFGKDVTFFKTDDPEFISATVSVNVGPNFLGWVMCFGKRMKIVSPEAAIQQMRTLSGDIYKMYADN